MLVFVCTGVGFCGACTVRIANIKQKINIRLLSKIIKDLNRVYMSVKWTKRRANEYLISRTD